MGHIWVGEGFVKCTFLFVTSSKRGCHYRDDDVIITLAGYPCRLRTTPPSYRAPLAYPCTPLLQLSSAFFITCTVLLQPKYGPSWPPMCLPCLLHCLKDQPAFSWVQLFPLLLFQLPTSPPFRTETAGALRGGPGRFPLNDLCSYNLSSSTWTALSPNGTAPSPRFDMGFTSAPSGVLIVFGGSSEG